MRDNFFSCVLWKNLLIVQGNPLQVSARPLLEFRAKQSKIIQDQAAAGALVSALGSQGTGDAA
jgi:hypothetical protein